MNNLVKLKNTKFTHPLTSQVKADGGKDIVERLIRLFGVRNRLELAEVLDTHPGTFSTWQTRNTTPYEMLIRIHLATSVPLDYLCFGHGKGVPDIFKNMDTDMNIEPAEFIEQVAAEASVQNSESLLTISINVIHNGGLLKTEEFAVDGQFHSRFGITNEDFAIEQSGDLLFVNTQQQVITKGDYLFSVNGAHQIGELKQLPDGNIYFYDDGEKHLVDTSSTEVLGKVVSVLIGK